MQKTPRRDPNDRPFRLTAVIGALGAGGAERMMAILTRAWAERGWHIELVLTLAKPTDAQFFEADPRVRLHYLDLYKPSRGLLQAARANVRRVRGLRPAIRATRPDAVLAFTVETNVLTILATLGLGVPVVVEEHIFAEWPPLSRSWRLMRLLSYPLASSVVALTPSALATLGLARGRRGRVVRTPFLPAPPEPIPAARPPVIVAMGRLVPQKGFDMLIDAFAPLARRHPDLSLEIWGEGPERSRLERRRDDLGLAGRVRLPGTTTEPHAAIGRAGVFVMSSRREGFPMVLGEAMASGVPWVSCDCRSGPRELIRDGVDGLLVPPNDVAALSNALERLVVDRDLAARLRARAPEVVERFSLSSVLERWDDIFAEVGATSG